MPFFIIYIGHFENQIYNWRTELGSWVVVKGEGWILNLVQKALLGVIGLAERVLAIGAQHEEDDAAAPDINTFGVERGVNNFWRHEQGRAHLLIDEAEMVHLLAGQPEIDDLDAAKVIPVL